jgi:hypothetical protein
MRPNNRIVSGNSVLAVAAAGVVTAAAEVASAAPGYTILRQLTNLTTGTIEAAKIRSQDGNRIAFVSNGDVMGPGTQTVERQIYLWEEQPDGSGAITRITNQPGCESWDVARPTDDVLSNRPEVIAFVSTCDFDPLVGNADGNPEIFFYEVVSGIFHQITNTAAPVVNAEPYTSDSGRCLVFRSNGDLDNNDTGHPHYDSSHPGPGYSNADGSNEVFLYGKLDQAENYPYTAVFTQVSDGPAGTTSSKPVINGYWFARQCQTTAYQSDHDQLNQGFTGQGIFIYKMPMSSLEPITGAEIPMGFPDGIYRNPAISAASPFARGPHIVFEAEPDLWRNESVGTDIFDWRDFHPRMSQFTRIGLGKVVSEPQVGDGGGIMSMTSDGELLHPEHELRTGELPPFNPDGNHEVFVLDGRKTVLQLTATSGCQNLHTSLDDDGDRLTFISDCDVLPGNNPNGVTQIFIRQLERLDYPLLLPGACEESAGCCISSRKLTTCAWHPLKGRKLKIPRPNCIDKPKGCDG